MAAKKKIPEGYHTLSPHLTVKNCGESMEFYKKAFGAVEIRRSAMPDGRVLHAEMQLGGSRFFLNDEFPEMGARSPASLGGSPVTIHIFTEDVDKLFAAATAAGATVVMPLDNQFWGDRYGIVSDPSGHLWSMATRVADLTNEEIAKAAQVAMAGMQ